MLLGWTTYGRQVLSLRSVFAPSVLRQVQNFLFIIPSVHSDTAYFPLLNAEFACVFYIIMFTKSMQLLLLPLKVENFYFLPYRKTKVTKADELSFIKVYNKSEGSIFKSHFCFLFFSEIFTIYQLKINFVIQHILQVSRIQNTHLKSKHQIQRTILK